MIKNQVKSSEGRRKGEKKVKKENIAPFPVCVCEILLKGFHLWMWKPFLYFMMGKRMTDRRALRVDRQRKREKKHRETGMLAGTERETDMIDRISILTGR